MYYFDSDGPLSERGDATLRSSKLRSACTRRCSPHFIYGGVVPGDDVGNADTRLLPQAGEASLALPGNMPPPAAAASSSSSSSSVPAAAASRLVQAKLSFFSKPSATRPSENEPPQTANTTTTPALIAATPSSSTVSREEGEVQQPGAHTAVPAAPAELDTNGLSAYERERQANIARNEQVLRELGLLEAAPLIPPPRRRSSGGSAKRKAPPPPPAPSTRTLRARSASGAAVVPGRSAGPGEKEDAEGGGARAERAKRGVDGNVNVEEQGDEEEGGGGGGGGCCVRGLVRPALPVQR